MSTSAQGLTSAEVAERVAQGRVNRVRRSDAASTSTSSSATC
jgi:hypothetical protein